MESPLELAGVASRWASLTDIFHYLGMHGNSSQAEAAK